MKVLTQEIFSTPTWRIPLPELVPHHPEIVAKLRQLWDAGGFKRHGHGYGYQTPGELFTPGALEEHEYLRVLKEQFVTACTEILKTRHGHSKNSPFDVYAVQAWMVVQTNEDWVEGPWHHHHPATLSGVYYIQVPQTRHAHEGLLMFKRPEPTNIFTQGMAAVRPAEGHLIVFPSYLDHRPAPTPTATDWRICIAMDAFVHWKKRIEDPLTSLDSADYAEAVKKSRGE